MAASTPQTADDSHQRLLDQMDITAQRDHIPKLNWKPHRRNKTVKQIISESQRKEASVLASQNNSGATTPFTNAEANTGGAMTPTMLNGSAKQPNIAQAAQSLSTLVLEKSLQRNAMPSGPPVKYTDIEFAPTLRPVRRYCDITGLPSRYTDPRTRLRYYNLEVFAMVIRTLPPGVAEKYLEARGAHVVLK